MRPVLVLVTVTTTVAAPVGVGCGTVEPAPALRAAASVHMGTGMLKSFRFAVPPQVVAVFDPQEPGGGAYGTYFRLNRKLPLNRSGRPAVEVFVNNGSQLDKLSVLRDDVPKGRGCYLQGTAFADGAPAQTGQSVQVTIYALAPGGKRAGSLRMRGRITRDGDVTTPPSFDAQAVRRVGCS